MRYATIPHSTSCSDLTPATNPYGTRQSFSPGPRAAWSTKAVGKMVSMPIPSIVTLLNNGFPRSVE